MANETCPPDPIGVGGNQTDLNSPQPTVGSDVFIQRHNLDTISALCGSTGLSPSMVMGVVMQTLKNHFADPALIMTDTLKQYVWADSALSKIRIALNTRFDPKNDGLLPALVLKRGDIASGRKVIGDKLEAINPQDTPDGVSSYVRYHEGSLRIFVIAEADGEAEDLALEVFDTLTFLAPIMVERLPFHDFQVGHIGELGALDGLANKIGVPIEITFAYEYAWAIKPLAPRLKRLNIDLA